MEIIYTQTSAPKYSDHNESIINNNWIVCHEKSFISNNPLSNKGWKVSNFINKAEIITSSTMIIKKEAK